MRMSLSVGMPREYARGGDGGVWQSERWLTWKDAGTQLHACFRGAEAAPSEEPGLECLCEYDGLFEPELADLARVLSVVGPSALFGLWRWRELWPMASDTVVCAACDVVALMWWAQNHPLWGRVYALACDYLRAVDGREVIQDAIRRHYALGVYAQHWAVPRMGSACRWCGRYEGNDACAGAPSLAACDAARVLRARARNVGTEGEYMGLAGQL